MDVLTAGAGMVTQVEGSREAIRGKSAQPSRKRSERSLRCLQPRRRGNHDRGRGFVDLLFDDDA